MVNYVTGLRLAFDWHVLCQSIAYRRESGANPGTNGSWKWPEIGIGLARIGMDWQGLAKIHRKIDLGLA